jgi:bacillithiol system protein YtxJ
MSFFNKIIGGQTSSDQESAIPWHNLEQLSELKIIEQLSYEKPVAIFKHSTGCGISRMSLKQFENEYNIEPDKIKLYFLDLLNHRDVSNEIAVLFKVPHQSPQILVIKNGACVYNTSHDDISAIELSEYV